MKKILAMGLVALGLGLLSQQQAAAYSKFNFGVGMNFGWECSNNNILWGLCKSGPGPGGHEGGYGGYGAPAFGGHQQFGDPGMIMPAPGGPETLPVKPTPTPGVAQPAGYYPYAPMPSYGTEPVRWNGR